jgi:hypothetical protein
VIDLHEPEQEQEMTDLRRRVAELESLLRDLGPVDLSEKVKIKKDLIENHT